MLQSFEIAARAWRGVLASTIRPRIWVPFLLIGCVQLGTLCLLIFFHEPTLVPTSLPLVRWLGGENAVHYPAFFFLLPEMFEKANIAIGILVNSIAAGAGTLLFARAFGTTKFTHPWRTALRHWPSLAIITALAFCLLYGFVFATGQIFSPDVVIANRTMRWAGRATNVAGFILIQSFVAYTTAWVVLMNHNVLQALRDSIRVTAHTLLPTLMIVAVPVLLAFPAAYLVGRIDIFATKLKPDLMAVVMGGQVVGEMILAFFLVGAITRLFMWRTDAARIST